MRLTTKSRYAVMAVVEVACQASAKPVRLADISAKQNIPLNYLEQIFVKLRRANLVSSVKGPGGGYCLTAATENISIKTIIDAMEENLKMTRCAVDKKCKQNGQHCKTHNLWKNLSKHIGHYLASISVADVVAGNQINL